MHRDKKLIILMRDNSYKTLTNEKNNYTAAFPPYFLY
jgi:hypothetical protein